MKPNSCASASHDAPSPIDFFLWVIRNGDRIIVVDTGFDEAENQRRESRRRMLRTPTETLSMMGVAADTVEIVVITHLHFDHAGSLDAFGNARFHLQAAEMNYATGPCMCHADLQAPFTAEHVCGMVRRVYSGRVVFHDGDAAIAPECLAALTRQVADASFNRITIDGDTSTNDAFVVCASGAAGNRTTSSVR